MYNIAWNVTPTCLSFHRNSASKECDKQDVESRRHLQLKHMNDLGIVRTSTCFKVACYKVVHTACIQCGMRLCGTLQSSTLVWTNLYGRLRWRCHRRVNINYYQITFALGIGILIPSAFGYVCFCQQDGVKELRVDFREVYGTTRLSTREQLVKLWKLSGSHSCCFTLFIRQRSSRLMGNRKWVCKTS